MERIKAAGLCVGVSRYGDRALAPLPDAATSAQEIQKAFESRLVPGVTVMLDPRDNGALFVALERSMHESQGETFVLYFAGHALRRGSELLLAVRDSEVEGAKGCVPWSDVQAMLKREVKNGLVVLNLDQPPGSPPAALGTSKVAVMGSLRSYDARSANGSLRSYADVVLGALRSPAEDLGPYLTEGLSASASVVDALQAKYRIFDSEALSSHPVTCTIPHLDAAPGWEQKREGFEVKVVGHFDEKNNSQESSYCRMTDSVEALVNGKSSGLIVLNPCESGPMLVSVEVAHDGVELAIRRCTHDPFGDHTADQQQVVCRKEPVGKVQ